MQIFNASFTVAIWLEFGILMYANFICNQTAIYKREQEHISVFLVIVIFIRNLFHRFPENWIFHNRKLYREIGNP